MKSQPWWQKKEEIMRKVILFILMLCLMAFLVRAGDFPVKESEAIKKEFKFEGGAQPQTFEIDNVFGSINVTGYSGSVVKLSAQKTIRAKSKEALQRAKEEVTLDISSEGNTVVLFVDGPFRGIKGCINWNTRKTGYIVQYDFEVKVPRKTGLLLKTVNKGDIDVSDVEGKSIVKNVNGKITINNLKGDFEVHTVNGKIKMDAVTGSGEAHTVNGKVAVSFDKNPGSDCSFHTINGKLDVTFLSGLSADFKLKTFNGKIYSDFPSTYLPAAASRGKRQSGKYVYKSSRFQGIRIGAGGPTIKMDTLNGNIFISKR